MTEATAITGDLAFYLKRLRLPRVGEHLARMARVLAQHRIHRCQNLPGTGAQIVEIADGSLPECVRI